jgi:Flp pilus assembly protein TadD
MPFSRMSAGKRRAPLSGFAFLALVILAQADGPAPKAVNFHRGNLAVEPHCSRPDICRSFTLRGAIALQHSWHLNIVSEGEQRLVETCGDFAQGEERYRAGAYAEATAIFARLSQETPRNADVLRLLGLCRLRLGQPAEAIASLAKAYALAPSDPFAQLDYGIGLHAVGRHAEAAAQFRRCAPLLPENPAPFLNLASALLALGDAAGALDAARRARRRAPEMPQAHYTLGLAYLADERFAEAAEAFAACLKRAPEFAEAWVNLGVARYRASDIEGAKAAMRRALAAAPGHRAASANLAVFLRLTGEVEAGEALLRDLVARDPGADGARLNLVADLLQEERSGEALALLEEHPMPAEPQLARHWVLQRSLTLLQRGRAAEAREALALLGDLPPGLRPLLLWRRVLLALAAGERGEATGLAGDMEVALAAGAAILPEHRIMGHFELARFWTGQSEPDRAFPHWVEGHRLLGRIQPFSRAAAAAFFDATVTMFDRARLANGPRAQNRDEAPVFIVGMPRSGTTLCEQIVGAHATCFAAGERPALGRLFGRLGGESPDGVARIAALDGPALDAAATAYLDELHALAPAARRVVDKMPGNFNYLGLVGLLLPGARIIHCTRDPRDIGLSIFTYRFYGWHPYAHDLGDLGWYIAQHDRLMAHWRTAVPNPILTVALKDWVADFAGTLARVLAFLDLPYDPACERFYEQDTQVRTVSRAQVKQPVNARGLDRWQAYERQLQPLVAALTAGGARRDL